jgi:hypothetical protein
MPPNPTGLWWQYPGEILMAIVIRKNEGIMTTQNVTIPALSGGSFSAYLAAPSSQPRAGIVLIQEVLGVNNNMRQTADVVFGYA